MGRRSRGTAVWLEKYFFLLDQIASHFAAV
jgi:hypothetical protein